MNQQVFLGLGANLGDPQGQLQWAVQQLHAREGMNVQKISSLYQTKPVGGIMQPDFLNAVVQLDASLAARDILKFCLSLEAQAGRIRSIKNAPRLLDIDVLLYGKKIIDEPDYQVPHVDLAQRAFVLVPLVEIAADMEHPKLKKKFSELLNAVTSAGTQCIAAGPEWAGYAGE